MTGAVGTRRTAESSRGGFEPPLPDRVGERAAAVGVSLLIVTGFASSYTTLRDLAVEVGGFSPWLAPVVPLSFDLGIVVLSLKVVLAARAGQDARVLRILVLVLSAATVAANGAASTSSVGRLLHAVPPAMFVVCFEALAASARHDARTRWEAACHDTRVGEVLTAARWLLAPRQTWMIWRARVLGVALQASTTSALVPPAPAPGSAAPAGWSPSGGPAGETAALSPPADAPHGWPTSRRPAPPLVNAGTPELPLTVVPGAQGPIERSPAGQHARLSAAVEALQADPDLTAVALAGHLGGVGYPVSVRTAQRVRHLAEQQLGTRPPGAAPLSSAGGREGRSG